MPGLRQGLVGSRMVGVVSSVEGGRRKGHTRCFGVGGSKRSSRIACLMTFVTLLVFEMLPSSRVLGFTPVAFSKGRHRVKSPFVCIGERPAIFHKGMEGVSAGSCGNVKRPVLACLTDKVVSLPIGEGCRRRR